MTSARRLASVLATWLSVTTSRQAAAQGPPAAAPAAANTVLSAAVKKIPLAAMTRFAVLDEPRLSTAWSAHSERLVDWLGAHGFDRLDGVRLPAWITSRLASGNAYGSVVVLPRGVSPSGLFEGPSDSPLWLRYLRAGGRIVHVGDLPFNYVESPDVAPLDPDIRERGRPLLGLTEGWTSPFWGDGTRPVSAAQAARDWGLETADGAITGVPLVSVTLGFHVYTVAATGQPAAADWFVNVAPSFPWSGLVKLLQGFDGSRDADLRDVWRAAHYVGAPVAVPPTPPPVLQPRAQLRVDMSASGVRGRREFVRGERVTLDLRVDSEDAQRVRWELFPARRVSSRSLPPLALCTEERNVVEKEAAFELDTAPYADGDYGVRVTVLRDGQVLDSTEVALGIRYSPPEGFAFQIEVPASAGSERTNLEYQDIRRAGMEVYTEAPAPARLDLLIRNRLGFSLRAQPDHSDAGPSARPEYFRVGQDGKPLVSDLTGGRPMIGLSHPDIISRASAAIQSAVRAVANVPAFRPYVLTNDDYSALYGWDYAAHVIEAFKQETGRDVPRQVILPPAPGPVGDDNAWLTWFRYSLRHVDGSFNKLEKRGAIEARPDVRVGPIPGGMQVPLVQLWEASQYPTYSFGDDGFNLISYYYYNRYWQPLLTNTFWMEVARMGHRDLPEWTMPDALLTPAYTRSVFFHDLAGGAKGLVYFDYPERSPSAWPEIGRLGAVVRRIGGVQLRLAPARRDIGFLNSFTTNCFEPAHTLEQVYAYHNLMQAHFGIEVLAEEEAFSDRAAEYKAIVLHGVKYISQSAYDALSKRAARGGIVLLDTSVPFDIPHATRLDVDLATGAHGAPQGSATHGAAPGPATYGRAPTIAAVRHAVEKYVEPQFESDDARIVASPFEADGMSATWFVNAQDGDEYAAARELVADEPKVTRRARLQRAIAADAREMAKGPFVTDVIMREPRGVPYDLIGGGEVPIVPLGAGAARVRITMDRFGGTLVAWLPSRIRSVDVSAPKFAHARTRATVVVRVSLATGAAPGALPVEFTLRDPSGAVSPESGVRVSHEGAATFEWTPGVGDPEGPWSIDVRDVASGQSSRHTVVLSAASP